MFAINHAATALVLKRRFPTVRMAFILLAVQAVELLWVALNLIGVEATATDATVRSVQNIHLVHMPWSHSIATTFALAVVAWALIRFALGKPKTAIAVAVGIASHLILDLATHSPDIAIAPGLAVTKLGTGFYGSVPFLAFLFELGFGIACWRIYGGSRWLLLAIIGFNVANVSMFLPQVVGIEAALAGRPTELTLIILIQIVVTLAMVGWLSRSREPTGVAVADAHLAMIGAPISPPSQQTQHLRALVANSSAESALQPGTRHAATSLDLSAPRQGTP